MKFKGQEFISDKRIVRMNTHDEQGNLMPYADKDRLSYVIFGKITKLGEKKKGAFKTSYKWNDSGEPVYAIPIESDGHSLTSVMYGKDGYTYLMKDGQCYKTKEKRKKLINDFSSPSKYKI